MTKEELDALGHGIAFDAACSVIERNCCPVDSDEAGGGGWWNIDPDSVDLEAEDHVLEALKYLNARGLIEKHPEDENWVQMRDESEATVFLGAI